MLLPRTRGGEGQRTGPGRTEERPIRTMVSTGYRYRIILRGECGPLLAGSFGDVVIESSRGRTSIIAVVRDDSALYGLLDRIQDLALHLVSINELGTGAADPPAECPAPPALGATAMRRDSQRLA